MLLTDVFQHHREKVINTSPKIILPDHPLLNEPKGDSMQLHSLFVDKQKISSMLYSLQKPPVQIKAPCEILYLSNSFVSFRQCKESMWRYHPFPLF